MFPGDFVEELCHQLRRVVRQRSRRCDGCAIFKTRGAHERSSTPIRNPRSRRCFPRLQSFSPLAGTPHVAACRIDPNTNPTAPPVGFPFWTTDLMPNERGYQGPIEILMGMDMTGVLSGIVVDSDTEPYGFSRSRCPSSRRSLKARTFTFVQSGGMTLTPFHGRRSASAARRVRFETVRG